MKTDLKTLKPYHVRLIESGELIETRGYSLVFEDFTGFEFIVHRSDKGSPIWEVSERTTGCLVTTKISHTREQAIRLAYENLIEKGIDRLREAVNFAIEKFGEANDPR